MLLRTRNQAHKTQTPENIPMSAASVTVHFNKIPCQLDITAIED